MTEQARARVLLVESDPEEAAAFAPLIEEQQAIQLSLAVADRLESALQRLDTQCFDVVVLDPDLPDVSGMQALALLGRAAPHLPLVLLTTENELEQVIQAAQLGVQDYLVKGELDGNLLQRTIRYAIERKRSEERLRLSEERFRTLVSSMEDVVFTVDRQGFFNGLYGRWLVRESAPPSYYEGRSPSELFGPKLGALHEKHFRLALAGESLVYEADLERDGKLRQFHISLSPMHDTKGQVTGLVGVGRDVTEQRKMQGQLLLSERMASMGTLAAGVAHEINNPLASVLTNIEDALRNLSSRDELIAGALEQVPHLGPRLADVRDALAEAREAAERVRTIVRDLKVFSRSDEVTLGPVDVQRVLESSLRLAWNEIRHRARLCKDFEQLPPVHANEARLGQLFLNLLINAAQAIPEGKADKNSITLRTRALDDQVLVEIQDTGCGVPEEIRASIFEPFFTTKPMGQGTGLGLTICQRIVAELKGQLSFSCADGKGTVFRVLLCTSRVQQPEQDEEVRSLATQSEPLGGRILVIDDDAPVGSALRRILRDHQITLETRAQNALTRLNRGEQYDLIICDLMMPEMTGMDLHGELERTHPALAERMIFMTGGAFTPRSREFLDRVPNPRVEKPFESQNIRSLVAQLLK